MRYIQKQQPPQTFLNWTKSSTDLKYKNLPGDVKADLKQALLMEQGYLCAYTMKRITMRTSHVEHFFSQSQFSEKSLDFKNMIACYPERGVTSAPKNVEYGAVYKDNNTEEICSPHKKGVSDQFIFKLNGKVEGTTDVARTTIRVLNLNHDDLVRERREWIEVAISRATSGGKFSPKKARSAISTLEKPDQSGKLEPFCTAMIQVLSDLAKKAEARAARLKKASSR